MKFNIFVLLIVAVSFQSCEDDLGTLTLNFKATYDDSPLVMFDDLDYDDYKIRISQSEFYISEIKLLNGEEEIVLKDIDFIDFSSNNVTMAKAEEGIDINFSEIEPGQYTGLSFSIGVPPANNGQKPADFPSSNPLSKSSFYWDAWDSYIFAKLQGTFEDTPGNFDASYFFHTGTDELFRTFALDANIEIGEGGNSKIEISMDHSKLLVLDDGSKFNISESAANHDPTDLGPLQLIVNNYQSSMTVK